MHLYDQSLARNEGDRAGGPRRCSATDDALADLRADGVRVTRQRLAILHVLREASDHPRAEDILTRARQQDPSVSQATVYRTLAILEKAGTVQRNEFDGAGARFELADRQLDQIDRQKCR